MLFDSFLADSFLPGESALVFLLFLCKLGNGDHFEGPYAEFHKNQFAQSAQEAACPLYKLSRKVSNVFH